MKPKAPKRKDPKPKEVSGEVNFSTTFEILCTVRCPHVVDDLIRSGRYSNARLDMYGNWTMIKSLKT